MSSSLRKPPAKVILIALISAFTLSIHYHLFPFLDWPTLISRRLCYIPILLGALWFGLRGGIIVSAVISLAVTPLVIHHTGPFWSSMDLTEIFFYVGIGAMTGYLVDRREKAFRKSELLGNKLEESEHMVYLGQMASGVAHEIRTPLGSIQGVAEIIGEDYPQDHPRRPFFDILTQEIERLQGVVHDFLDLGRPIRIEPVDTDLAESTSDCFTTVSKHAEEKDIMLKSEIEKNLSIFADPSRLHQVLTNLVMNAVQLSPHESEVHLRASSNKGGTLIQIDDSGPGLPTGEEDKIFEPFFTSRKYGTGLGLAIVSRVVLAHGGWIKAQNRDGGGARFTLWFPSEKNAASHPGETDNLERSTQ